MFKPMIAAAFALVALPAAAATVTLGGIELANAGLTSADPTLTVEHFEETTGVTIEGNYRLADDNSYQRAAPANDHSGYLTVPEDGPSGEARITFPLAGKPIRQLGLYWGSIDDYNWLSFLDAAGKEIALEGYGNTLDGAEVRAVGTGAGDQVNPGANQYVNISFSPEEAFTTLVLHSNNYAFEIDNLAYSSRPIDVQTPEPAMLGLLGLGMGAIVLKRRRG